MHKPALHPLVHKGLTTKSCPVAKPYSPRTRIKKDKKQILVRYNIQILIFFPAKRKEIDPYFLQSSQNLMINSLLNYLFCSSCEHEIVFDFVCRIGRTISGSQLVQKSQINKESAVNF